MNPKKNPKKLDDKKISEVKRAIHELRKRLHGERKSISDMENLFAESKKSRNVEDKNLIISQITSIRQSLRETNRTIMTILSQETPIVKPLMEMPKITLPKKIIQDSVKPIQAPPLKKIEDQKPEAKKKFDSSKIRDLIKKSKITSLEKETLKRIRKKGKVVVYARDKKPNPYVTFASKMFSDVSQKLAKQPFFEPVGKDLLRANLQFILANYISVMLLTIIIFFMIGIFAFFFFLMFNIGAGESLITRVEESLIVRASKIFWIPIVVPLIASIFMFFYPSMEKKSLESKINQELPFATIHMSAISGSLIDPSQIFRIVIETKEYPYLEKEFTKLMNEINVYGFDLVSALKNIAKSGPSLRLTELFNGLATTLNSGGELSEFFDKRSQTLLFDYKIEREKKNKSAETFMDIYISVVIAAPMILMLLLMMMKASGLGVALSTGTITLVMILVVSMINVFFLMFLHFKQT